MTSKVRKSRFADVFIVLFCISGAAFTLNLFTLSLNQTVSAQNKKPLGTVTIKNNNVQRRLGDRVLWSRLFVKAPIYLGDLVRTAEYSSATLHLDNDDIDLNENTLIRIYAFTDNEGRNMIGLSSGSLTISSDTGHTTHGVVLDVMEHIVVPQVGTVLNAFVGEKGMVVQVIEGSATITGKGGEDRPVVSGETLALDVDGVEQKDPEAVLTYPLPNARVSVPEVVLENAVSVVTLVLPDSEGELVTAAVAAPVAVTPSLSPLSVPRNLRPAFGSTISFEELRTTRKIDFSWSPVNGANAYFFTLYNQSGGERRQIVRTEPLQRTGWTLDNLSLLDNGTFIWQVEAVNMNNSGKIENRSGLAESTFIVDASLSDNIEVGNIEGRYEN